jgi:hypothetical protein
MAPSRWLVVLVLVALSPIASAQNSEDTQAARTVCREDAHKLCANVYGIGGGAIRSCLESQKDKLSAPCRQALGSLPPQNPWKSISPSPGPTR